MGTVAPTIDDARILRQLATGKQLRRVRYRGPLPAAFVARRCIDGTRLTRLIAGGWVDDVTPPEARERGEAIYRLNPRGAQLVASFPG